jgi:raffinose/stachyose/melibiose transport system substrate-binding protein
MKSKFIKKLLCSVMALTIVASMAACGSGTESTDSTVATSTAAAVSSSVAEVSKPAEPVTLKVFSNSPDRATGVGKLEDDMAKQYMSENPNVTIQFEALQDEPYKQKFKAYTASNSLPDIFMVWGQSAFFGPVMKGGYAAELNVADYADYKFVGGTLEGYSMDGKLYGLPRNLDTMLLLYNKAMFDDNGLKVPTTYKELLEVSKAFRAKGIAPVAMTGKDKWPLGILYQDLVVKLSGNQKLIYEAMDGKTTFAAEPDLLKAAQMVQEMADAKVFQDAFTASDYGAANNLFAQEKAAMYYMGSWTMSMAGDANFSDHFKQNVGATTFPVIEGGKGTSTDALAWCGAGYAVSAKSANKEAATKFLNYMLKPENSAKLSWQSGAQVPAQDYSGFMTGKENQLQTQITQVIAAAKTSSGVVWYDNSTPAMKTDGENLSQKLAAKQLTPEQFLAECDKAATSARGK